MAALLPVALLAPPSSWCLAGWLGGWLADWLVAGWLAAECRGGKKKDITKAKAELHEQSIRPLYNPLHKAPMGDTEGVGLFSIAWPELMHQKEGGDMKKAIMCTILAIQLTGQGK